MTPNPNPICIANAALPLANKDPTKMNDTTTTTAPPKRQVKKTYARVRRTATVRVWLTEDDILQLQTISSLLEAIGNVRPSQTLLMRAGLNLLFTKVTAAVTKDTSALMVR
jgi:hypothetical protein